MNPNADLIETVGEIDPARPIAALYEELAALINRYHRARPQIPVSEIVEVLNGLYCAVSEQVAVLEPSAQLQPMHGPVVEAEPGKKVIRLLNIFDEIKGEWLYEPRPHKPVVKRPTAKKRARKKAGK